MFACGRAIRKICRIYQVLQSRQVKAKHPRQHDGGGFDPRCSNPVSLLSATPSSRLPLRPSLPCLSCLSSTIILPSCLPASLFPPPLSTERCALTMNGSSTPPGSGSPLKSRSPWSKTYVALSFQSAAVT